MATIIIRTTIMYVFLITTLRVSGKRQVGQLQVAELVITLLLSELAAMPIYDPNMPLLICAIPIVILISFEIIASFAASRNAFLKKMIEGAPSIIIKKGVLDQAQMKKIRLNVDELLAELRLKNISDIADVEYAILEQNGQLSVIAKTNKQTVTREDLSLNVPERGVAQSVIIDGKVCKTNLNIMGKTRAWLDDILRQKKCHIKEVYVMTVDDNENITLILKDKNGGK
jgi:uncharacterized membrane protein YcaP (DUF421 family)